MYTINQLKTSGAIYIQNIQNGFDNYAYEVIKMNLEEAYKTIKDLWILNGSDNSYADFYYFTLDNKARNKVEAVLSEEEKLYLERLYKPKNVGEIIYPLEETFIKILIKLNYLEILFSTFYFIKKPCTMWGNYNHEYVVFTPK